MNASFSVYSRRNPSVRRGSGRLPNQAISCLRFLLARFDGPRQRPQCFDRSLCRAVEATLDVDCACARNHVTHPIGEYGMGQDRRSAGTAAHHVAGFLRRLPQHSGAKIFPEGGARPWSLILLRNARRHSRWRQPERSWRIAVSRTPDSVQSTHRAYSSVTRVQMVLSNLSFDPCAVKARRDGNYSQL